MFYVLVGGAIGIILALILGRRKFKQPIQEIVKPEGFARSDELVTVTLNDGTVIETTAGEFSKRVLQIDNQHFWVTRKFDIVLGAIYCVIGIGGGVLASIFMK